MANFISKIEGKDGTPYNVGDPSKLTWYGYCSTASDTADKVVNTENGDFKLDVGASCYVSFAHGQTAKNITLNIDGTGAIPVTEDFCAEYENIYFFYDGSDFQRIGPRTPVIRSYRDVVGTEPVLTSPYTSARLDVSDSSITEYIDGMVVYLKVPSDGFPNDTRYGAFQINLLGYHPIIKLGTTTWDDRWMAGVPQTMMFVYEASSSGPMYSNSDSPTQVQGVWRLIDYSNKDTNTDTTIAHGGLEYYFRPYAGTALYRYKYCMLGSNNKLYPIVTTNQTSATQVAKSPTSTGLRPQHIWFYNSANTVNANTAIGSQTLQTFGYTQYAPYTFNTSIPAYTTVYLRGRYDASTDLFYLYNDGSSPCTSYYTTVPTNASTLSLSDYFVDGYYYYLVGGTYSSANDISLFPEHKLYYFDGQNLVDAHGVGQIKVSNFNGNQLGTAMIAKSFDSIRRLALSSASCNLIHDVYSTLLSEPDIVSRIYRFGSYDVANSTMYFYSLEGIILYTAILTSSGSSTQVTFSSQTLTTT